MDELKENEGVKVSNKDFRSIENDMLNEINQSENENAENSNDTNTQNANVNQSVQIPAELAKIACATVSYVVHEKRIQTIPKTMQNNAREVIKPTEKQIETMGTLLTWIGDRYAPSLFNSPYSVPLLCVGVLAKIEYAKVQVLSDIINKSKNEN